MCDSYRKVLVFWSSLQVCCLRANLPSTYEPARRKQKLLSHATMRHAAGYRWTCSKLCQICVFMVCISCSTSKAVNPRTHHTHNKMPADRNEGTVWFFQSWKYGFCLTLYSVDWGKSRCCSGWVSSKWFIKFPHSDHCSRWSQEGRKVVSDTIRLNDYCRSL